MASVTGMTADAMEIIRDASIVDGNIDGSGHLILTTYGGTDIDAGYALVAVPDASTTVKGVVELATSAETIAGTDAVRAVTPAGLAATFVPDASTTVKGRIELATDVETLALVDALRAVTPSNLSALLTSLASKMAMTGEMKIWPSPVIPSDWLLCDGSSLLNASYTPLYNKIVPVLGTATITIASPGVVTFNAHGLIAGDTVCFTTTGALPTGLVTGSYYFVLAASLTSNTFRLATLDGDTAIVTTGSQSGVHTLRRAPFGIPDSTHFWLPPMLGRTLVGRDASQMEFSRLGKTFGAKTHTLIVSETPAHNHQIVMGNLLFQGGAGEHGHDRDDGIAGGSNISGAEGPLTARGPSSGNTGGGGAHNNIQPSLAVNFIIKT